MELLKLPKTPKGIYQLNKSKAFSFNVRKTLNVAPENAEKINDFLRSVRGEQAHEDQRLGIDKLKSFRVSRATRTSVSINLVQMAKDEIQKAYDKIIDDSTPLNVVYHVFDNKNNDTSNSTNKNQNDNDNDGNNRGKTVRKTKPKKRKIDNGVAEDTFDEFDEILSKYQKYTNDDAFQIKMSKSHIMNNKMAFVNTIKQKMMGLSVLVEDDTCDTTSKDSSFQPLVHQLIVRQYLNSFSPYRGLLLYHGLGSGKTCSSVGIIESMRENKERIFIMTPASLQKNYKTQMKFCGNQLFKDDNFWEFVTFPTDNTRTSFMGAIHKLTRLPMKYLRRQNGVYLINKERTGESNYHDLSTKEKERLDEQINMMIDYKFEYINYNGITQNIWNTRYSNNGQINPFHNSTIIIDEGHNFVSRIVNKINTKKNSVSTQMYEMIMSAENCNVVVLSGTPLINYPCELGVLFNLIGGYTYSYELRVKHSNPQRIGQRQFVELFRREMKTVDIIQYMPYTNVLRITQNPYGFIRNDDGSIRYDEEFGKMTSMEFKQQLINLLRENEYKILESKIVMYKKLPDEESEFNKYFVGSKNNFVKKKYFQSKIVGMVSYLGDKRTLMPDVIVPEEQTDDDIFIERVMMNDYVLKEYSKERKKETEMDKRQRKSAAMKNKDSYSSSYRIFSRTACNFVFPEDVDRPMPRPRDAKQAITEDDLDNLDENEMLSHNDGRYDESDLPNPKDKTMQHKKEYAQRIEKVLAHFEDNAHQYFESTDITKLVNQDDTVIAKIKESSRNNLSKYAPKFHRILTNIMDETKTGLHLLYSNFRNLGGIGIFTKILHYYGYSQLRVRKTSDGINSHWTLDIQHPYYKDEQFNQPRQFYALYTGKETTEEKEMIRNIFNSEFNKIPLNIYRQLQREFGNMAMRDGEANQSTTLNNHYGQMLKLLIISSSGAEGIDLKNVRFVHIMEPYWHPVRVSQVIGRARRICSHKDLPKELQNVQIFLYMLSYDRQKIESRRDDYIELLRNDTDEKGNIITTDERLYQIMLRKKKLMEEFLTGIKEASIDCMVNYDDKDKCLTFPKLKRQDKTRPITELNYKDDRHTIIEK
jgi:hypothetical protein